MAAQGYQRNRYQNKRQRIDSQQDTPAQANDNPKFKDSILPLYRAYRKATTAFTKSTHHKEFLTTCIDNGTTPRGLRPNIQPQVPNPNTDFILKWEEATVKYGQKLTEVLQEYWTNREETLKWEVERCNALLKERATPQEMDDIESITKQLSEELRISLRNTKNRKTDDLRASTSRTQATINQ